MTPALDEWWDQGTIIPLNIGGAPVGIFTWDSQAGRRADTPTVTLLHGWPTSSWDWSRIAPLMATSARVIAPDFMGLGRSSKGDAIPYDFRTQADMLVALWEHLHVATTAIVAHDFGTIVTQELLARQHEGILPTLIESVVWLNGSLDASRYEPTPGQLALLDPDHGPALAHLIDHTTFTEALAGVHARRPADDELAQHWTAMSLNEGHLGSPRFLRYIPDRADDAARLLEAFTHATIPMRLVWGVDDPVSGRTQLEALTAARPDLPVLELADTGHYPHTEQHEAVSAVLASTTDRDAVPE